MKKVLIFPGAFNPPHYGHIEAVKLALHKISFDELWIVPSGNRNDKTITTSFEDRRALGTIFVEYLQKQLIIPVKLITAELDNKQGKFTHEIIKDIKSSPGTNITQLIGTDGFSKILDSIDTDEKFIVINRTGYEFPKFNLHTSNVILMDGLESPISSTQIRNMIKNADRSFEKLVPSPIANFIKIKQLYQQDETELSQ